MGHIVSTKLLRSYVLQVMKEIPKPQNICSRRSTRFDRHPHFLDPGSANVEGAGGAVVVAVVEPEPRIPKLGRQVLAGHDYH